MVGYRVRLTKVPDDRDAEGSNHGGPSGCDLHVWITVSQLGRSNGLDRQESVAPVSQRGPRERKSTKCLTDYLIMHERGWRFCEGFASLRLVANELRFRRSRRLAR